MDKARNRHPTAEPFTTADVSMDLDELEARLEQQVTLVPDADQEDICPYYFCSQYCGGEVGKCIEVCYPYQ